jgi:alpha-D-xyloside xylohydrolase
MEEEFLFGDALLVAPVLREDDTQQVYLPEGHWQDFWDGLRINGGVSFEQTVPRDRIPVYVKAGTILPVGPDVQYAAERPWDDLQVRIYTGADGDFVLYEDEGDGYAYEKGVHSEIPMHWDDSESVLTIGPRKGSWPGMSQERQFRIVIVRPDAGTGLDRAACDVAVPFSGREIRVDMN